MRERRDLGRKRLPLSTYEAWLSLQKEKHHGKRRGNPSPDVYEEWLERKVRARIGRDRGRHARA